MQGQRRSRFEPGLARRVARRRRLAGTPPAPKRAVALSSIRLGRGRAAPWHAQHRAFADRSGRHGTGLSVRHRVERRAHPRADARRIGSRLSRHRHRQPAAPLLRGRGRQRRSSGDRRRLVRPRRAVPADQVHAIARGQDHRLPYDAGARIRRPRSQQSFAELARAPRHGLPRLATCCTGPRRGAGWRAERLEVWRAMEALHASGRARLLGVSNVSLEQLAAAASARRRSSPPSCRTAATRARAGTAKCARSAASTASPTRASRCSPRTARVWPAAGGRRGSPSASGARRPQIVFRFALQVGMLPLTGTSDPLTCARTSNAEASSFPRRRCAPSSAPPRDFHPPSPGPLRPEHLMLGFSSSKQLVQDGPEQSRQIRRPRAARADPGLRGAAAFALWAGQDHDRRHRARSGDRHRQRLPRVRVQGRDRRRARGAAPRDGAGRDASRGDAGVVRRAADRTRSRRGFMRFSR